MRKLLRFCLLCIRYIGCVLYVLGLFYVLPFVIIGTLIYGSDFWNTVNEYAIEIGNVIDDKINELKKAGE